MAVATLRGNVHFFSDESDKRVQTVSVGIAVFSGMTVSHHQSLLFVASVDGIVTAINGSFSKVWTVSVKGPIFTSLTIFRSKFLIIIEQNKRIDAIDITESDAAIRTFKTPESVLIQGTPVELDRGPDEPVLLVFKSVMYPITLYFLKESQFLESFDDDIEACVLATQMGECSFTGLTKIQENGNEVDRAGGRRGDGVFVFGTRNGDRLLLINRIIETNL